MQAFSKAGHGTIAGRNALGVCFSLSPAPGQPAGEDGEAVGSVGGVVAGNACARLVRCLLAGPAARPEGGAGQCLRGCWEVGVSKRLFVCSPRWDVLEREDWEWLSLASRSLFVSAVREVGWGFREKEG